MKTKSLLFAAAIIALAFTSCKKDNDNVDLLLPSDGVHFASSISAQQTKASGTQWDNNDAIGIFMKKYGETLSGTSLVDAASNKKFTTPADGNFTAATSTDAIYLPSNGDKVDFIAYYPYQATISNFTYPVNVETQTTQENIDLLYSNDAVNKDKTSATVALGFTHKLSKIVINISKDASLSTLTGLSTKISGLNTKANFSLVDGTLSTLSDVKDITLKTSASGANFICEAIVIPQASGTVTFTIPTVGTFTYSPAVTFEANKKYTYNVTLKNDGTGNQVELNAGGATITDWIDNVTNIDIDKDVTGGDGSQASPYLVSQIDALKIGETKWVEGYVIGMSSQLTKAATINNGGTYTKENILIAESSTETDITKCISIELTAGDIQDKLNLQDHPTLKGTKIKVLGTIKATMFGLSFGIENPTNQEGGIDPTPSETVYLEQNFNGCSNGTAFPNTNASIDISTDLSARGLTGWTGSKVYEALGAIKMGTSSAMGWIQTPTLSTISGTVNITVSFTAGVWAGDPATIGIEIIGGGTVSGVTSVTIDGLNSTAMQEKTVTITGATSTTQIKLTGLVGKNRFFIDDLKIIKAN